MAPKESFAASSENVVVEMIFIITGIDIFCNLVIRIRNCIAYANETDNSPLRGGVGCGVWGVGIGLRGAEWGIWND